MNPLNDITLLKHHRVDYRPRIDRDGARIRPARPVTLWVILALGPLALIVTALAA